MDVLGHHVLIDCYGCPIEAIDDCDRLESVLTEAAEAMGATIEVVQFKRFEPHGVSGTVVISESHLTLHTWPEHEFAAVDVFVCSDELALEEAVRHLEDGLRAEEMQTRRLERGRTSEGSRAIPPDRAVDGDEDPLDIDAPGGPPES